jgi:putative component of membrane protein insertase Oxa1/YidC/SpoIIIJ protein YidD
MQELAIPLLRCTYLLPFGVFPRLATTVVLLFLLSILLPPQQCCCQLRQSMWRPGVEFEPWEAEDLGLGGYLEPPILNPQTLAKTVSTELIRWYRQSLSTNSIQRCPFYPSCSFFAEEAIDQHGFLIGLCLFIDRNLYRENPQMYQFYNLVAVGEGVLKLDDRYFLDMKK